MPPDAAQRKCESLSASTGCVATSTLKIWKPQNTYCFMLIWTYYLPYLFKSAVLKIACFPLNFSVLVCLFVSQYLIYPLFVFSDRFSSLDWVVSCGWMINKEWSWRNVKEGKVYATFCDTVTEFTWNIWQKPRGSWITVIFIRIEICRVKSRNTESSTTTFRESTTTERW